MGERTTGSGGETATVIDEQLRGFVSQESDPADILTGLAQLRPDIESDLRNEATGTALREAIVPRLPDGSVDVEAIRGTRLEQVMVAVVLRNGLAKDFGFSEEDYKSFTARGLNVRPQIPGQAALSEQMANALEIPEVAALANGKEAMVEEVADSEPRVGQPVVTSEAITETASARLLSFETGRQALRKIGNLTVLDIAKGTTLLPRTAVVRLLESGPFDSERVARRRAGQDLREAIGKIRESVEAGLGKRHERQQAQRVIDLTDKYLNLVGESPVKRRGRIDEITFNLRQAGLPKDVIRATRARLQKTEAAKKRAANS